MPHPVNIVSFSRVILRVRLFFVPNKNSISMNCSNGTTIVVPRDPRARYHGSPYTISYQDALKNATTFDLGVSVFRLPPPTWLVIFWGRGILLVFCSTTFANKETWGGEQKRLAKTKLCYSCIIFTTEMVTFFCCAIQMLKFLGNGLTYRPCLVFAMCGQLWTGMRQNMVHPHMRKKCFLLKLKSWWFG